MPKETKQSKGGKARAKSLSKERRKKIAEKAAAARWNLPQATHDGPLAIHDIVLECAVLDNKVRVISERKFMEALGMYRSSWLGANQNPKEAGAVIPRFLGYKNLKPYIVKHLTPEQLAPLKYFTKGGAIAHGIRAEIFPKICEVWLDAMKDGNLGVRQQQIAEKAEILIRGFAQVGIVALIDEATGFQYERQKNSLAKLLEEFLTDELRRWVRTFPKEYFKELCRLKQTPYRPDMRLPPYFGHITNEIIYERLAPYVLQELQAKNPKTSTGRRKNRHHQYLSDHLGHPKLLQHLGTVIALMQISSDWDEFKRHLDKVAPNFKTAPLYANAYLEEVVNDGAKKD